MKIKIILIVFSLMLVGCGKPSTITVPKIITLHTAVISGNAEKIKLKISEGAWLNLRNEYGWTAFHYAVVKNSPEIIQLLIDKGVNINIRDKKRSQTPLHFTALTGKKEAIELLLLNGANPHTKDINGKVPKQLTTEEEIVDIFSKYGY